MFHSSRQPPQEPCTPYAIPTRVGRDDPRGEILWRPNGESTLRYSCEADPPMGADSTEILSPVRNFGTASSSSALGHPRHPKSSDTSNRHAKGTEDGEISQCHVISHHRDTCDLSSHPDFNRYGNWVGSASETAIRAHLRVTAPNKKLPNVPL